MTFGSRFDCPPLERLVCWLRQPDKVYRRWQGRTTVCVAWLGLLLAAVNPPHGTGITVCLFNHFTGLPCPGCGLTRSLSCGLRGMFLESLHYHPMGLLILTLFIFTAAVNLFPKLWRERIARHMESRAVFFNTVYLAFVVAFVGFGIVRAFFQFANVGS